MIPSVDRVDVLLSQDELNERISALGAEITARYRGRDLTLVGILKGSALFLTDLMRAIALPLQIDFLELSSYKGGMASTGSVRLVKDLTHSIEGKDVIIVEDIVDTGLTLRYLLQTLATRKPASLATATLLDKPSGRVEGADCDLDFVGFTIPGHFVVGYGLDLAGYFRNLPYVGIYHPEEDS
ncbi:MAG: hypoxanthine phosphoribosyltransferase [Deltaproteobacteria bacterium]|nr:hypoxanthine phosphoribosyltransferase [Deltaproteobacteria bacterium]